MHAVIKLSMDSRDHFRNHFEQAPFSMQLLSSEGKTLAVNRAWKDLWKIPEDIINNYILTEYNVGTDPQLEAKGLAPIIRRGLAGEIVEIPPILYVPKDTGIEGEPKWVSGFMYPIKDKSGKIVEIVLTHQNITERKNAEDEAKKLTIELQNALKARDEFISICSHELKTPITSLKLQVQMTERMLNSNDERVFDKIHYEKRIGTVARQIDRMMRLIDEMLDISRVNLGKLQMESLPLDIHGVLEETLNRFSAQFSLNNIDVKLDFSEGNWIVKGDKFRLEQVFSNILTNAIKYGEMKPIEIKLKKNADFARIEFKDQGIGISSENLERIFSRFERVTSLSNFGGLGLGLFISKEIVNAHEGKIWAESGTAGGTIFIVEIPLA